MSSQRYQPDPNATVGRARMDFKMSPRSRGPKKIVPLATSSPNPNSVYKKRVTFIDESMRDAQISHRYPRRSSVDAYRQQRQRKNSAPASLDRPEDVDVSASGLRAPPNYTYNPNRPRQKVVNILDRGLNNASRDWESSSLSSGSAMSDDSVFEDSAQYLPDWDSGSLSNCDTDASEVNDDFMKHPEDLSKIFPQQNKATNSDWGLDKTPALSRGHKGRPVKNTDRYAPRPVECSMSAAYREKMKVYPEFSMPHFSPVQLEEDKLSTGFTFQDYKAASDGSAKTLDFANAESANNTKSYLRFTPAPAPGRADSSFASVDYRTPANNRRLGDNSAAARPLVPVDSRRSPASRRQSACRRPQSPASSEDDRDPWDDSAYTKKAADVNNQWAPKKPRAVKPVAPTRKLSDFDPWNDSIYVAMQRKEEARESKKCKRAPSRSACEPRDQIDRSRRHWSLLRSSIDRSRAKPSTRGRSASSSGARDGQGMPLKPFY